ncbi:MAG: hypothetical protein ACPGYV_05145, partial [Phycisphaeraceae bacterium]
MKIRLLLIVVLVAWCSAEALVAEEGAAAENAAVVADEAERTRLIEVEPMAFSLRAPATWQLTLNEREKMFLRLQETRGSGELLPTNLNIQYRKAEGEAFPPIPDAETYAKWVKETSEKDMPDMELLSAEAYERDGYRGAKLVFRFTS